MKTKLLFYPSNLNIREIIDNDSIFSKNQKETCLKYYQRILYPISRIIMEYRLNKSFKDEKIDNVYIPLSSKILQKNIFGKPLLNINIIDFLIRNNIIIRNPNKKYKPNEYSFEYRLNNEFILSHYNKEKITDKTLLSNLSNKTNIDFTNSLMIIIKNNLGEVQIDIVKALNLLNDKINSGGKNNNNIYNSSLLSYVTPFSKNLYFIDNYFNELLLLDYIKDDDNKKEIIENWYINISMILEEDFYMTRSDGSGRIFTNLTSIPRELRECIYIKDNEKLCEIDISNSQPFLFNKFLLENFNYEDDIFGDKYNDVKLYIDQTSKGILYDDLIKLWDYKDDRNLFKKEFFGTIFYCKVTSNFRYEYSKKFSELYPNVMELIIKMKEGNYKNLAIQLQKIESDIMIFKVCYRLSKEAPGVWFATIHDSIMCEKKDKEFILMIVKEEFNKQNMFPTLKIKQY